MRMISGKLAVLALALMTTGCDASVLGDTVLTSAMTFLSETATALIEAVFTTAAG